jgi:hypothetical protein
LGVDERENTVDGPVVDDPSLDNFNAEFKASKFINQASHIAKGTQSKHNIIIAYGDDFSYENAYMTFSNLEKLIKACNKYNK